MCFVSILFCVWLRIATNNTVYQKTLYLCNQTLREKTDDKKKVIFIQDYIAALCQELRPYSQLVQAFTQTMPHLFLLLFSYLQRRGHCGTFTNVLELKNDEQETPPGPCYRNQGQ